MLCLDMKLITRFRSEKRQSSTSTSSPPSSLAAPDPYAPPHRRDRSKSLSVDRITPLLHVVEPKVRDDAPLHKGAIAAAAFARRRSTTTALSASSDLISRRGVFSRRHYGSVELLPQVEAEGSELNGRRFRIESGEALGDREEQMYGSPSTPILENPEYQTRWYFKYFLGKLHQNYVGCDSEKTPFFLSVVLTDANNQCVPQYRAILWRKTGAQRISLSHIPNKPMTVKQILSNFQNMDKLEKGPKEIFTQEIQKDLLLLEEQEGSVNFKFGILYMKSGQTSDDEILSNEAGTRHFEHFLGLLGQRIRLRHWDKYRGGLDVKGDMTGKHSVYTIYEGHEIMFHVSTMLPFSKDNKQQVERKRHIGNDIVNIVFLEGNTEDMAAFSPSFIKSQFTHVFALVSYLQEEDAYRLHVYSEETVPLFGPSLPCPPVFYNHEEFREFLLVKLINGEKATFNTPTFAQKRERTLDMLIKDLFQEHINDSRGTMLNRRAFSDVLPDPPRSSRRKEEARQVEFVRFGQALKLDTIVKGDAPTSLATTGLFKRTSTEGSNGSPSSNTALHARPWEPQCCYPDFPSEVVCGDSWGDNRLVLASVEGVFLVEGEGVAHRPIFDKSVQVKQLSVVEAHGILLLREQRGRDGKMHVFRLSDFEGEDERVRGKVDLKEHRLEKTKGCHLYAISRPGGSHLRMVVAAGRKLLILQWRHSAAWTAWCPASDTDTVEGFLFLREVSVAEPPSIITLVDSPLVSSAGGLTDNKICIGYKHQWDLVSERSGEVTKLHHVDASKVNLVAALDIYEDDEAELLLCYNNTCHFQKLSEECSNEFDFHWNSVPEAIVCAFPYILAFTQDSIEIRLIINGNLVQTMVMPRLAFITSKSDIFFATTAPESFTMKRERVKVDRLERDPSLSPPPSPHGKEHTVLDRDAVKPFRIYRIPFRCLTGTTTCERRCPTPSTPLHPPVLGAGEEGEVGEGAGEGGGGRAGMHLRVADQRYTSRSCTASPTHHPSPPTPFPGCPPSPSSSPGLSGPPNTSGSPTHHLHHLHGPQKPRDRTNSLTVDSAGSLLHHHHHHHHHLGRPHLFHSHSHSHQHHSPPHHHHHHPHPPVK
ncbi:GTPase-activating Rap/Ran-GAP domain-like protein 3 isoform X6 [Eriocheir sinensis]|uniref:GTPase-activating Rap/Ran-GAP domain-like protein 3 isoform X6 n=1 Tax=Eriocheir sinensis TaxID=95602 RepID=UPI0021C8987D|nr:GTPase-activating Rap/Ran-GAP domain-like protein 3 isoform X6 [Eriocheir sinensis]